MSDVDLKLGESFATSLMPQIADMRSEMKDPLAFWTAMFIVFATMAKIDLGEEAKWLYTAVAIGIDDKDSELPSDPGVKGA